MCSINYEPDVLRPAADGSLMALADCDTFYASCERVCRPDLAGKPIVVLSNNDGCIVAASREAKNLGIPMGAPEYQARELLRRHNVAVFSSNYTLYGDLSRRTMLTIASIVPDMEIYSIDEAFVPLRGALAANANEAAQLIRRRVRRWVGLPVSIGIAPTRVLAKIATRIAKKCPSCQGIYNLLHCRNLKELLASVPVKDIWGVGRKGALKLKSNGIHTALDLRDADPETARRLLTVRGLNILMELRGIPSIGEDIPATHTVIISSRSLGYKVRDVETMQEAAAFHAARAAEKLHLKKLLARMIGVRIQTAWYREDQPRHDEMAMIRLNRPTLDTAELISAARRATRDIFKPGYAYAKVLVMLTELSDPSLGQCALLTPTPETARNNKRRAELMRVIDHINTVEGRGMVTFAAQGARDAAWHMNRDRLSPAWTTDIRQLLRVGAGGYLEQFTPQRH